MVRKGDVVDAFWNHLTCTAQGIFSVFCRLLAKQELRHGKCATAGSRGSGIDELPLHLLSDNGLITTEDATGKRKMRPSNGFPPSWKAITR